ncbi:MAG: hypothetical protein HS113_27440 [Verrucomicrobiales bacterium]|nr:hypothetical protein [Verrucomicrobiales bacterium]
MKLLRHPPIGCRAMMLVEALIYISVFFVILAAAGAAYSRVLDHTRQLRRVAADIARAVDAGERWRADLRHVTAPPRLVQEGPLQALHLPHAGAEIVYFFDGSNVIRRTSPDDAWRPFLNQVKATRFVEDARPGTTAWRWELELLPGPRAGRTPALFTFLAVPPQPARP